MADINRVELFGYFGGDVETRILPSGREIAVFCMATDAGYFDPEKGVWSPDLQWHHCFTYQHQLVQMLKERGRRGARAILTGQLKYRYWRKENEDSDRTEMEIMIGVNDMVNFVAPDPIVAP